MAKNEQQTTPPEKPGSTHAPSSTAPSTTAPAPGPIPFPAELAKELGINAPGVQDFPLLCPHCGEPVREVLWRTFGNPGNIGLVGCAKCRKVLGAHLLGHIIY